MTPGSFRNVIKMFTPNVNASTKAGRGHRFTCEFGTVELYLINTFMGRFGTVTWFQIFSLVSKIESNKWRYRGSAASD